MATSIAVSFKQWAEDLEEPRGESHGIKTVAEPTNVEPKDLTEECICCHGKPDFVLIRLAFGLRYDTSIRYGICSKCHGTEELGQIIANEMVRAYQRGERDTQEGFQTLIDAALTQFPK